MLFNPVKGANLALLLLLMICELAGGKVAPSVLLFFPCWRGRLVGADWTGGEARRGGRGEEGERGKQSGGRAS